MKLNKSTIYIGLFSILYLIVAFSSFYHACAFFGLANNSWMSVILAFAFEIGQAAVLFSLLTSKKDRSRVMPWVLMTMFTLVQVIGNVFSSYKYIITNSVENLRYFKEPIFIWTNLPDDQATVIIVYIVGAILPICALLLTSMITNYLSDQEELKNDSGISNDTKEKLTSMLNDALDNTSEKDWNEFLDDKSKEEKPQEKEKELEQQVEEKVEKIEGTDPDGEVIGEQGEDGLKVLTESLNSKDNEIEKLKKELEIERSLHQDISEEFPKVVEENGKKDEEIQQLKEDHDKVLDEKFETEKKLEDALEKTGDLNKSLIEKNNEIEDLKREIEKLNKEKESQVQPIKESEKIEDNKIENVETSNENLKQVEDLIKNGITQEKKDSHFINI